MFNDSARDRITKAAVEFSALEILEELEFSSKTERNRLLEAAMQRAVELRRSSEMLQIIFTKYGTISRDVIEMAIDNGMVKALSEFVDRQTIQNALNSSSIAKRVAYNNRYYE